MSTLTTPPLSTLLPKLLEEAEASQVVYRQKMAAQYTPEERRAQLASATACCE